MDSDRSGYQSATSNQEAIHALASPVWAGMGGDRRATTEGVLGS
jgi:hypothetical protein